MKCWFMLQYGSTLNTMLVKEADTKDHILCEISGIGKSLEMESTLVFA